ncbi:hypothetical protein GGX14DRAFT_562957 [Mycena pura]|uniref:Uncharacterized protein n=1 Tax=Mycena pura TaxID=153505 RepID=A0AAD6VJI4_9AGAR|nr:hypothetical protein GGX14DRAFT_562957 [Mycena pura]
MQFKAFAFIAAAVVSANALSLSIKPQSDICVKSALLFPWTAPMDGARDSLGTATPAARRAGVVDDSATVAVKVQAEASDICWRACFHEKPRCPNGWNAKQLGQCWTCCAGDDSDDLVSQAPGQTLLQMNCNI